MSVPVPAFAVGDKVAYSAEFCRSIGAFAGDIPHMRGVVRGLRSLSHERCLVSVEWSTGETMNVLDANLAHVGPNLRFCAS